MVESHNTAICDC